MPGRGGARFGALLLLLIGVGAIIFVLVGGGEEEAKAQTVQFQKPTEAGPDPFTKAADVKGKRKVKVGSGPFGGSGSDLVCDRELLIRSLRARPDRQREWARVRGIAPDNASVAKYIRSLKPVTLTQDTRVTNHSFKNGRAVAFQAILQAGTAVLVDKDNKPVVRCRCGNPLAEPVFIPTARCVACPPNYRPPPPCAPPSCIPFTAYPNPPRVRITIVDRRERPRRRPRRPRRTPTPLPTIEAMRTPTPIPTEIGQPMDDIEPNPTAFFSPRSGVAGDTYTLFATGWEPGRTLRVVLTRPDGVVENYTITTGQDGSGSHTFAQTGGDTVLGVYEAVVTNPATGAQAVAQTEVRPG